MFTGLIESTGRTISLEPRGEQARLTIEVPFSEETARGDSVAINGCCLTVVEQSENSLAFDILTQTLDVTSLGSLKPGALVNLERALRANDRLGGHFVQGHVDATGVINDLSTKGQDHRYEVQLPPEVYRYCISRGSLAVDGISLTIAELLPDSALFWITPHTFRATNLQSACAGQKVNLEADLLAKYVEGLARDKR
ncbi:MAG: riboflavin synthase [Roseibacillus sp.]|nr:riboflavin synthase [Roseibacillus sp.]|tara:strand:+ start:3729 stop:4319 length:591 start_codon:yes stop_codon:yes gene_type:complete